jgi:hypothetical protein
MLLGVRERIELFLILPSKGSYGTLKALREFQEALELTEAEKVQFGVTIDDGRVTWKHSADVEIPVAEELLALIAKALEGLDSNSQLPATCMSLYEKFVLKE